MMLAGLQLCIQQILGAALMSDLFHHVGATWTCRGRDFSSWSQSEQTVRTMNDP